LTANSKHSGLGTHTYMKSARHRGESEASSLGSGSEGTQSAEIMLSKFMATLVTILTR